MLTIQLDPCRLDLLYPCDLLIPPFLLASLSRLSRSADQVPTDVRFSSTCHIKAATKPVAVESVLNGLLVAIHNGGQLLPGGTSASRSNLDAVAVLERADEAGVEIIRGVDAQLPRGMIIGIFRDPDGYTVEVIQTDG